MKPEPFIPIVFLSLNAVAMVVKTPRSSATPPVGMTLEWLKSKKSNLWASTNTSLTRSPPPPGKGVLWQPEQELESGPDKRSKFRGKVSGDKGSDSGLPV